MDVNAILDEAKPVETTVQLCLHGPLVAQFEDLERQLAAEAAKPAVDSLAAGGKARELAEQIEALREQMLAKTVTFRLRALPRRKWRTLVDAHQPRRDANGAVHADDADLEVDTSTFFEPLIRACLIEPELDEPRLSKLLDETLSDRQFEQLAGAAFAVNRHVPNVPFSSAASSILRRSERE